MSTILYVALGNGAPGEASLASLPGTVKWLELAPKDITVSAARELVEGVPEQVSALVLALGRGEPEDARGTDWIAQVHLLLRRTFGVLTGAGRRFVRNGGGSIVVLLPSTALGPAEIPAKRLVLQRAIVGMTEALRAELQGTQVRVSLVFQHGFAEEDVELATRLAAALADGPMYSLSADITAERIEAYFKPILAAVDLSSEGQPLPDIGPMAMVYDLASAGAPEY